MRRPRRKTFFEQISLQEVEKLRIKELVRNKATGGVSNVVAESATARTQPYGVRDLTDDTRR